MEISKKKLLKKMIFNMSVILFVSTATLCAITERYFFNIYKEEVNKYNSRILSQVQKIIDLYLIREVECLQSEIISLLMFNEDFNRFVNAPSISSVTISNLHKKLRNMKNNNNLIQDISVYSYSSNIIMSSTGVKFLDDSKNELLVNVPWKNHMEEVNSSKSWLECRFDMLSPYSAEPENFIYFLTSYPLTTSTRYRKAIISIGIKESSVFDNMAKIVSEDFGQIFMIDSNRRILSHANKEFIGIKPEDMLFLDKIRYQDDEGFLIDSFNGRQVVVNFKTSDYYDWKYIVMDDYDMFYHRSKVIRIFVLFISSVVLLFGVVLVILSSRNLYKPFKALVQYANEVLNKASGSDVSIDEMDEINIIDKAFEQMSCDIESLQEFVESKKNILRRAYFNGLISEENDFENILSKNMTQLGVHFYYKNFVLMVLDIISDHEGQKSVKDIEGSIIIEFIEGKLSGKNIIFYGFTTYKNDIAIIINYEDHNDCNLFQICESLKEDIERSFKVNISMGISGNTDDLDNINILYKQALNALSYKFMYNNASIFCYNELVGQHPPRGQVGFKLEYVSNLLDYIKLRHKEKVQGTIKLIVEHLFNVFNNGHSIESIKEYIVFIASDLTKLAYDLGYSEQKVFGINLIQDFIDINNINELECKLEYYCYHFVEFLENEKKEKNLNLVRNAIEYMRKNMANDLSLITVADFVGVGPSFLSKIFKEETGIKFVDYCIDIKLEYAQKLLEEGKLQIEEVSQKVGYNQTQYFIRKFKEKYGITPKQYQMKFLHESSTLDK